MVLNTQVCLRNTVETTCSDHIHENVTSNVTGNCNWTIVRPGKTIGTIRTQFSSLIQQSYCAYKTCLHSLVDSSQQDLFHVRQEIQSLLLQSPSLFTCCQVKHLKETGFCTAPRGFIIHAAQHHHQGAMVVNTLEAGQMHGSMRCPVCLHTSCGRTLPTVMCAEHAHTGLRFV